MLVSESASKLMARKRKTPTLDKSSEASETDPESENTSIESDDAATSMVQDVSLRRAQSASVGANKQRCLILGTRAISKKERCLIKDFHEMLPHSRGTSKIKLHAGLGTVMSELTSLYQCNTTVLLNPRKSETDLWIGQSPKGPSALFSLVSISTAAELSRTGNCLKYSRPLLHFDNEFTLQPHLKVLQVLLTMCFGTPKDHPRAKPFHDHMYCFFFFDGCVWFRNYQFTTDGKDVMEIGPRFVLYPRLLVDKLCGGNVLWKNKVPSPHARQVESHAKTYSYRARSEAKKQRKQRNAACPPLPALDPLNEIFQ